MLFSNVQRTFCRRDHVSYKKSINKFKKFEITSSIFSEYNSMKLEIDYKKKKNTNMWKVNNMLLHNQWRQQTS